jgi:hypothetical protein
VQNLQQISWLAEHILAIQQVEVALWTLQLVFVFKTSIVMTTTVALMTVVMWSTTFAFILQWIVSTSHLRELVYLIAIFLAALWQVLKCGTAQHLLLSQQPIVKDIHSKQDLSLSLVINLAASTINLLNICVLLSTLLPSNVWELSQLVHQLVVQMEDAEHMEIGAATKSWQTVRITFTQLVSAQIVAKLHIAMHLLQMQDQALHVCWFLTTSLNIAMMETSVHLTCAILMQPLQVLVITSLTVKQTSKRLSAQSLVFVKPLVVWPTVVFTLQSIATSAVFALIMFVTLQPTTLVSQSTAQFTNTTNVEFVLEMVFHVSSLLVLFQKEFRLGLHWVWDLESVVFAQLLLESLQQEKDMTNTKNWQLKWIQTSKWMKLTKELNMQAKTLVWELLLLQTINW